MKILFYVILKLIFIIAAWFWGDLFFISMLKPGETCLTANYGINIGDYLELGWNNYFQWFSNIEQMPCRITFAAWCLYFLSCFPAYALLKVYGMFKLSITLTPSLLRDIFAYSSKNFSLSYSLFITLTSPILSFGTAASRRLPNFICSINGNCTKTI